MPLGRHFINAHSNGMQTLGSIFKYYSSVDTLLLNLKNIYQEISASFFPRFAAEYAANLKMASESSY